MAAEVRFKKELLDELLAGHDAKTVFENDGLLDELKKALAERILNAELDHHLGQEGEQAAGNVRNGASPKTVLTDTGKLELAIPRDRQGRFEPALIAKYQRRFPGFDQKIIALYARGIKIRDEGAVKNKAVYLAIGVRCSGHKEVLGIWIEQTEGAKFWLRVMTEIRNRGTHDVLIAVVDGLKGFPEAINAVFPEALVQTCIVHLIRYSMQFASWKERKAIAAGLKPIYGAESAAAAASRLEEFDAGPWGEKYPAIGQSWRRNWEQVIPFFAFPAAVRRIIYTTNAIESMHSEVRKAVRGRGHFPSDEAATKLIWLALRNITAKWKNPSIAWHDAKAQFAIQFEDRFVMTRG